MSFPLPKVSVCIPAYNAGKYIGQALDSVLQQSYQNIEIVVVNDGSTDNTGEILAGYRNRGVTVINQENRGQCAAANAAFLHSTGEYIKFFDADDLLSPDFIKNQMLRLNGRTEEIASAKWGRFLGNDVATFALEEESVYEDLSPIDWLVRSLESGRNMMQCGLWLIPRTVLSKSGLWDERLSLINDFDFFIRVLLSSKRVLFTDDAILYYRSGLGQSLSAQKTRKALESAYLSVKLGTERLLAYENSDRIRKICADSFQIWKYQFYPSQPDLYQKAESQIKQLGGSNFPFPAGGVTKVLSTLIGWKKTKQLKIYLGSKAD